MSKEQSTDLLKDAPARLDSYAKRWSERRASFPTHQIASHITPCFVCGHTPLLSMRQIAGAARPWPVCERPDCIARAERIAANEGGIL